MDGPSQAAVTPAGVRDGDPAVLAALIERRGPAVLAFCDAVCEPEVVPRAVAEAFARFRALVATVENTGSLDPEAYLLGATRHAAASMARPPSDGRGVLRAIGRGASPETYAAVPALLAARADSMLGSEDLERLSRLLERSAGCREVEAAFRRAERGYRSPPDKPLSAQTSALALTTMQAAAPVAEAFAPVEAPDESSAADVEGEVIVVDDVAVIPDDVVAESVVPAAAEVVLRDPVEDVPATAWQEHDDEDDDGATDELPDVPAPFVPDAHEDAGDDDATHPAVPPTDSAVPEIVAAVPPPTPGGRRLPGRPKLPRARVPRPSVPRPSLPHPSLPRPSVPRPTGSRGGGLHLPRREQPARDAPEGAAVDHGPIYRLLLPAVAILVGVLIMLAIAGVFSGADPAPATTVNPAANVMPVPTATAEPGVVTTSLPAATVLARTRVPPEPKPSGTNTAARTTPSVTTPAVPPSPRTATAAPPRATTSHGTQTKAAPAARTSAPKRVVVVPADDGDTSSAGAVPVYEPGAPTSP